MAREKMDIAKVMAALSQPRGEMPPLENAQKRTIEIPYITKTRHVEKRTIRVFLPERVKNPIPLIFVPHYEMGEDARELRAYLKKGWAVASAFPFLEVYNGQLVCDDLVFNNAALYTLRHISEIDPKRIAVVGGSAGGYTTLMLNGLQLGLCASIANCPIANIYYNLYLYTNKAQALNHKALAEARISVKGEPDNINEAADEANPALRILKNVMRLPIPFIAGLAGQFLPNLDHFPDKYDMEKFEALTGVGIADRFSSPIMVNHSTSDVLVPVDQISRRFTYAKPGDSLPEDFDVRLPRDIKGKLCMTLEDCLPPEDTRIMKIPVPDNAPESILPFDSGKRFNINIYDDGPVESYGTHSSRMDIGHRDDIPYLEAMFELSSAQTCSLTPAMLKQLLLRYQGKSVALPAHIGVDESAYGSQTIYRNEILEELAAWTSTHGERALNAVWAATLNADASSGVRGTLEQTMADIMRRL